jgi:hypothetical protein
VTGDRSNYEVMVASVPERNRVDPVDLNFNLLCNLQLPISLIYKVNVLARLRFRVRMRMKICSRSRAI